MAAARCCRGALVLRVLTGRADRPLARAPLAVETPTLQRRPERCCRPCPYTGVCVCVCVYGGGDASWQTDPAPTRTRRRNMPANPPAQRRPRRCLQVHLRALRLQVLLPQVLRRAHGDEVPQIHGLNPEPPTAGWRVEPGSGRCQRATSAALARSCARRRGKLLLLLLP
jgi:hypothetical protein